MTRPGEGVIRICIESKARHDISKLDESKLNGNEVDGGEVEVDEVGIKVQKTTKSKNSSKSKRAIGPLDFFIPRAKLVFIKLRQAFFKTPILQHFDPKHYIQIEMDVSGYAIGGVLSQLILDNLGR